MKWNKQQIELDKLPLLKLQLQQLITAADPSIENTRCAFSYKDSSIINLYTVFDFIDSYSDITKNQLEKFYIYQPLKESNG